MITHSCRSADQRGSPHRKAELLMFDYSARPLVYSKHLITHC